MSGETPPVEPDDVVAEERAAQPLDASLAAQVQLLWELEVGDTPMALSFDPTFARD
jgi:hypothetical protein